VIIIVFKLIFIEFEDDETTVRGVLYSDNMNPLANVIYTL
jgi:hypothetical protein